MTRKEKKKTNNNKQMKQIPFSIPPIFSSELMMNAYNFGKITSATEEPSTLTK